MPNAQSMIFSATVPLYIQEIARQHMRSPLMLDLVGSDSVQMPDTISNELVLVHDFARAQAQIKRFVSQNRSKKILIFCETKAEVKRYEQQSYAEFGCLHGDLMQGARLRILAEYRKPRSSMVLVATDVAARGLDIDDIDVVIQQSVRNVDAFVHRTGRTGRAGKSGRNIVMHAVDTGSFQFFQKLEESPKCRFKVCNAIMDTDGSYDAEDAANEVKNEEA